MQYDLVIKNGKVILFNNIADFLNADIGINGSKIVTVGRIDMMDNTAAKIIDAKDCIVSPGFIDFHSHVDCNEDIARQLVLQGATTTIGGDKRDSGERLSHKSWLPAVGVLYPEECHRAQGSIQACFGEGDR